MCFCYNVSINSHTHTLQASLDAHERPICNDDRQARRNLIADAKDQSEANYIENLRKNDEPEYIKMVLRVRYEASASGRGTKRQSTFKIAEHRHRVVTAKELTFITRTITICDNANIHPNVAAS